MMCTAAAAYGNAVAAIHHHTFRVLCVLVCTYKSPGRYDVTRSCLQQYRTIEHKQHHFPQGHGEQKNKNIDFSSFGKTTSQNNTGRVLPLVFFFSSSFFCFNFKLSVHRVARTRVCIIYIQSCRQIAAPFSAKPLRVYPHVLAT